MTRHTPNPNRLGVWIWVVEFGFGSNIETHEIDLV